MINSSYNLIIFDIDGTLTQTTQLDNEIFLNPFLDYLNLQQINNNWHEYRYSTDAGIALEIFEKHINRLPGKKEIQKIKQQYFLLLQEKIVDDPDCCKPFLGANTLFNKVLALGNWHIAIATGNWKKSAFIKLQHANITHREIPLASSDDHIERHEIIKIALERAKTKYKQNYYDTVVYVGDKLWDYEASQKLGFKFIGIGPEFVQNNFHISKIMDYSSNDLFNCLEQFTFSIPFKLSSLTF